MNKFSRRDFIKHGVGAGLLAGASHHLVGCPAEPPVMPATRASRVAAIVGTDLAQMARDALDAFGGAKSFVSHGDTVFIKPNFCAAGLVKHNVITSGDSTKPEIVIAVVEECLKAGAARIAIGDAAQVPTYAWTDLATLDGSTNMAAEIQRLNRTYGNKVTPVCLNSESPDWDRIASPYTRLGTIKISSLVNQADCVISLPVLKTHRWTQITASLKNFVGTTSVNDYGLGGPWRFQLHDAGIEQCFLDIVRAVKPVFTIIDCSIGCEGNGPHVLPGYWGSTVDMRDLTGQWLVLASDDLAAADATAARVIGQDALAVRHLDMAYKQGIGQIQEDHIELMGARLDDLRVHWKPAEPTDGFWDILIPGIAMLTEG